ncbi:MAG: mercury resistance system periplasmic binding protein MerP [Rhodanobacter sp.]|nr:MAG: mercury resistance system periplasmic binding protein MerP [Rhodanobacter sp.]TAL92378.1 MAG: mercury resistance system periplasmic binding protein MerP [Rhodanobacter sp.]TAM40141.1 MAG: mercury resistance system periplasmic binding protein MerP [Rhodanobacter sp.]
MKKLSVLIVLAAVSAPAWATTKTATLSVPGMTCAACPITVKTALSKVPGVEKTQILFDQRKAIVTYDDTKISPAGLTKATADAGYPSTPVR